MTTPKRKKPSATPPFNVGDLVTTDLYPPGRNLVRRVTSCRRDAHCQSGWIVDAEDARDGACPHCHRPKVPDLRQIDSWWFVLVKVAMPRSIASNKGVPMKTYCEVQ
jgi:hypothetical protein